MKLGEYEEVCPKCLGVGIYSPCIHCCDHGEDGRCPGCITYRSPEKCDKCVGTGKITWIDKIIKK